MAIRVPPPEVPIISWISPNKADQGLLEFWNSEVASYTPLDVGAPHPNQRLYSGFRLGKQAPVQGDEKWVLRTWVSDETSPDWFNWALKYSGEDNSFPIFIRTYREPRATYAPRVKGTPLGTLYKTVMTNVGSGYANGAYPTVEFDLPTTEPTTLAIGHGVVNADGSITEVVLDFGGEGYTQNVEFRVFPPINGDRATGVAYVQPQTAILVKEEAGLYPPDSEFYAQYLQVTRVYETIPGPTFYETKLDVDGATLTTATTRKLCADISTGESINSGTWCKTTKKPTDIDVICEESVECRPIPGNPMQSTRTDPDGIVVNKTQTYTATASCVTAETLVGTTWTHKYFTDVDGTNLVSWQWVETREVNTGNVIPSANVSDDEEISVSTKELKDEGTITPNVTNPSGLTIVTTEQEAVSDLVSQEVITTKDELDRAVFSVRIPESIIPVEFRAAIPTTTVVHIVAGIASMPTLAAGEFFREELQYKKLLKRVTVESLGGVGFPIIQTNYETTEEYGGGILQVIRTLHNSVLIVDQGESVVRSEVREIGQFLMWFKETASRYGVVAWGVLPSRLWDENLREEYDQTTQVVVSGTSEDPNPGGVFGWVSEVKALDIWRSQKVNVSKSAPLYVDSSTALITYEFKPFKFPGLLTPAPYGYYVRSSYAELIQHKLRTWWVSSSTTPVITVEDIIPENIVISTLNDITVLAYSGMVLHDDITTFGTLFWPATTPSYTEYIASWQGVEHIVAATVAPEKEKDVWKIVTESVVMR